VISKTLLGLLFIALANLSRQIQTQIVRGGVKRRLSLFGFYVLTRMATAIIPKSVATLLGIDINTKGKILKNTRIHKFA
jgi:hypothetical protein